MEEEQQEIFDFLNDLRESSNINMCLAARDIHEQFGYDRIESRKWLRKWMESFKE